MIIAEIIGGPEVERRLTTFGPRLQPRIEKTLQRVGIALQARIVGQKLSGQVLGIKTSRLRRSINAQLVNAGSTRAEERVGTNVSYARVHELGFNGTEQVREHLRMVKQAWGRALKNPHKVVVRAHSRRVHIPEKSFLRSALAEMRPEILEQLRIAVVETAKEK